MNIYNSVRGHFALLIGKQFLTPAQGKPFTITDVISTNKGWQIQLKISTGQSHKIYFSDLLRVYTFILDFYNDKPLSQTQISNYVKKSCLTKGIDSYVIPLLETFSDIEVIKDKEPEWGIRFIPPNEQLLG